MHRLPDNAGDRLSAWLNSPRGRALVAVERRQLSAVMPYLIGYRLLQVGPWGLRADQLEDRRMFRGWVASVPEDPAGHLYFDGRRLPIASHCMDTVVLPHTLERCESPHQLLREADRVLCDRGQLVLLGFNPLAPAALAKRMVGMRGPHPVTRNLYGMRRVCDWLDLLDFEVVHGRRYGAGFPYLPGGGVDWQRPGKWQLPATMAQAYLLIARKRVIPVTPVRQPRRIRGRAAAGIPAAAPRFGSSSSEAA